MMGNQVRLAVAIALVFLTGLLMGQELPSTFIRHPVLTIRMMRSYPVGTRVSLADNVSTDMREYFEGYGLDKNGDAVIEGYVLIADAQGRPKINLDVRVGSIFLHSVDRSFFQSLHVADRSLSEPRPKYNSETN